MPTGRMLQLLISVVVDAVVAQDTVQRAPAGDALVARAFRLGWGRNAGSRVLVTLFLSCRAQSPLGFTAAKQHDHQIWGKVFDL